MSSTYSTNLGIELMATGENADTWGAVTNTNLGTLLEQAISGYVTQAVSTGFDTTITIPDGSSGVARNMYIELTGTGGAATNLIVPAKKKLYFIYNNTASGQVTVKVSGQSGVSVANGDKVILVCNGTDVVTATAYKEGTVTSVAGTGTVNGITLTGTVTSSGNLTLGGALSGVNLASQVTGTLPYNNGGTGQTSYTNGQLLIGNTSTGGLNKATLTAGSNITITNGNGTIEIAAASAGGTVTSVGVSGGTTGLTTSNSPITGSGTITIGGTLGLANGGTGQTTQQAALNALAGATTSAYYLRGNGTNVSMSALSASDLSGTVAVASGGTGQASYTNGQLLIGNTTGNTLTKSTLTAGTGITITNGAGSITISASGTSLDGFTGSTNTGLGQTAADSITSGTNNSAFGATAGTAITSGSFNTAMGYGAIDSVSTGSSNSALGYWAGIGITTGSYSTALGRTALSSGNYSGAVGVGANTSVTGNAQLQLGESTITSYSYGAVQDRSDVRDKTDIQGTDLGLDFIMALRPVKFKWDMRDDYKPPMPNPETATPEEWAAWQQACDLSNITHNGSKTRNRYHQGLIAQEVKATMDAMGVDFGGYQDHSIKGGQDVQSIGYNELIAPLIKAIQELKTEFDEYKRTHP